MNEIKIPVLWMWLSFITAVLVSIASISGILNSNIYSQETANWALQGRGQDMGNLIALPILLISTYFLKRKSLVAYFIWLGTMMYYIYAFIIYCFALHFNSLFLVYIAILGLSAYTLIGGIITSESYILSKSIPFNAKTKISAISIIIIGTLFMFLWLSSVIPAALSGSAPKDLIETGLWVNPVHVIDLSFVLPGMMITGILFLRKSKYGYLFTFPWLMFSALMGSSIIATMIMMMNQGSQNTLIPLVMVSIIVIWSLTSLFVSLRSIIK
jgi:hypothetical protein